MRLDRTSARVTVAIAAMVGVAACSNTTSKPMDDGLKTDLAAVGGQASSSLELAPSSAKNQVVVSAIEGGPESAPKPAAKKVNSASDPEAGTASCCAAGSGTRSGPSAAACSTGACDARSAASAGGSAAAPAEGGRAAAASANAWTGAGH